jgi:hypothetical protein
MKTHGHGAMKAVWIGATLCVFAAGGTLAQPADDLLTFEVASVTPGSEQTVDRFRNLLEERCRLMFPRESGEQQVYVLVVFRGARKLEESKEAMGRMAMGRGLLTGHRMGSEN